MNYIVLFDPSIRSLNMGDHIIMRSAESELSFLTRGEYVARCGTHSPVATFYQCASKNPRMKFFDKAKYKFVCGSNLLWRRMLCPEPSWNLNLFNCRPYEGCTLVGVGTHRDSRKMDLYTRKLYHKVLGEQYIHSTRDEATKQLVESLGLRAINTGCPTMWRFTESFCSAIPSEKSDEVVFTLTDYSQNPKADSKLIEILQASYEKVWFWPQGWLDEQYLDSLHASAKVKMLNPTLDSFATLLDSKRIDYVGTRLHAGMFAMQHARRSIIIAIDNRVRDMKETYGINSIERDDIDGVSELIDGLIETHIGIDVDAIEAWKNQFIKE